MNISNGKQQRVRLKQFLKRLSEDPSLMNLKGQGELSSLSELLMVSGYREWNQPVNMSDVISQVLRKKGLEAGSEDMMDFVMNGGTVEEFMSSEIG